MDWIPGHDARFVWRLVTATYCIHSEFTKSSGRLYCERSLVEVRQFSPAQGGPHGALGLGPTLWS